jgi:hypothetical protein
VAKDRLTFDDLAVGDVLTRVDEPRSTAFVLLRREDILPGTTVFTWLDLDTGTTLASNSTLSMRIDGPWAVVRGRETIHEARR